MTFRGAVRGLTYLTRDAAGALKRLLDPASPADPSPRTVGECPAPLSPSAGHPSSAVVELTAAADRPASPLSPSGGAGQPSWPDWCAAEMDQVADILLTTDSPFAIGFANDLRRAAGARRLAETLGNDLAAVHDRALQQRLNEDRTSK